MGRSWLTALAVILIAVPIHRLLGRVTPYLMRAVLCATRAAVSAAVAFFVVMLAMEVVS